MRFPNHLEFPFWFTAKMKKSRFFCRIFGRSEKNEGTSRFSLLAYAGDQKFTFFLLHKKFTFLSFSMGEKFHNETCEIFAR